MALKEIFVLHSIPARQKIIVMCAVMSGLFLVALDQTIISTALATIVQDFNAFSSLGFVVTAYLLLSTVTVPIAGKMSDVFGRRPVLLFGVIVFTVGSLLSGMSATIEQLIAYRALQGLGGGVIMANAFTIIGDLFSARERGKWQGIIGGVFGLSSVVGPLLGGFLTDGHAVAGMMTDWRWTFFINVPIGIVSALIIAKYCPAIRHEKRPSIDYAGAVCITIALTALVLAVDNTEQIFKTLIDGGVSLHLIQWSLYAVAAAATLAFIAAEARAQQAIIPLRFFANRTFTSISIAALLFGAAFLGAILYLTQFNQQVFGANATTAGLMLLPMIGGLVVASIIVGQFVSKTGKYKPFIVAGYSMATIGVFLLTTLQVTSPYWHEAIIMAIIGMGLGAGMPIMNLAVQNEFEQHDLGAATASTQLFRGLGSTVGTALFSGVLTAGVVASIGNVTNDAYIQTLKQSSAAAQFVSSTDAGTLLQVNAQRTQITENARAAIDATSQPQPVKDAVIKRFLDQQDAFRQKIVDAFTRSLHTIFFIAAVLMACATGIVLFIRERPLGADNAVHITE